MIERMVLNGEPRERELNKGVLVATESDLGKLLRWWNGREGRDPDEWLLFLLEIKGLFSKETSLGEAVLLVREAGEKAFSAEGDSSFRRRLPLPLVVRNEFVPQGEALIRSPWSRRNGGYHPLTGTIFHPFSIRCDRGLMGVVTSLPLIIGRGINFENVEKVMEQVRGCFFSSVCYGNDCY